MSVDKMKAISTQLKKLADTIDSIDPIEETTKVAEVTHEVVKEKLESTPVLDFLTFYVR